jgi:hypothetical protein
MVFTRLRSEELLGPLVWRPEPAYSGRVTRVGRIGASIGACTGLHMLSSSKTPEVVNGQLASSLRITMPFDLATGARSPETMSPRS